ncbi:hereditary hemochromatosis protein homolog [Macrotis lagotis]|uniref:hereditary hemochromatosis protein homolog n=1 Tax=Macrotis lagotis TaxID=92651 RepID=UPI003D6885DC
MINWRRGKGSFFSWLLILVLFSLWGIQTAYHKHEMKFIAVGTSRTLLDLTSLSIIDDIQWISYHKSSHQIVVKEAWISEALGMDLIEEIKHLLMDHEGNFQFAIHLLIRNETKTERNHTLQIRFDCELDGDIQLSSLVKYGLDGEDLIQIEGLQGKWMVLNPRGHSFIYIVESSFWTEARKLYNERYCIGFMKKILWKSNMKKNLPPEVYVSRQDFPSGTITFSCTATGFYPQSILLHWKMDIDGALQGKESSTGTLPNSDDTFYVRISLEIQPGDPGRGYACVVNHSQLDKTAVYSVPDKSPKGNLWAVALSIILAAILVISCFVVFTKWKKKNSGTTSQT